MRKSICRPADGGKQLLYSKTDSLCESCQRLARKTLQVARRIQMNPVALKESMTKTRNIWRDHDQQTALL